MRKMYLIYIMCLVTYGSWAQCPANTQTTSITVPGGTTCDLTGNVTFTNLLGTPTMLINGIVNIYGDFDFTENVIVNGILNVYGDMTANTASLIINDGGYVFVADDVNVVNSEVSVQEGGEMVVGDNYNNGRDDLLFDDAGDLNLDGDMTVGGSFVNNPNGTVDGSGTLNMVNYVDNGGAMNLVTDTDCSDGCCGGGCTTLPVVWVSTEVSLDEMGKAVVAWVTAQEWDNHGYWIEKSTNGKNFYRLQFVEGANTTTVEQSYSFQDLSFYEDSYYRIRQEDYNGDYDVSPVMPLKLPEHLADKVVKLYPSVVTDELYLAGSNQHAYHGLVMDAQGRVIRKYHDTSLQEIETDLNGNLPKLHRGAYVLHITSQGKQDAIRFHVE